MTVSLTRRGCSVIWQTDSLWMYLHCVHTTALGWYGDKTHSHSGLEHPRHWKFKWIQSITRCTANHICWWLFLRVAVQTVAQWCKKKKKKRKMQMSQGAVCVCECVYMCVCEFYSHRPLPLLFFLRQISKNIFFSKLHRCLPFFCFSSSSSSFFFSLSFFSSTSFF